MDSESFLKNLADKFYYLELLKNKLFEEGALKRTVSNISLFMLSQQDTWLSENKRKFELNENNIKK